MDLIYLLLGMLIFIGIFGGAVKVVNWSDHLYETTPTEANWIPSHIDEKDEGVIVMRKL